MISRSEREFWDTNGYLVVPDVFTRHEVSDYIDHYMELREEDRPYDFTATELEIDDPLVHYPRMIHMHMWDDTTLKHILDRRITTRLTELLDQPPFPCQSMLYFKPPHSRGQALHQDNFFLAARPGCCAAAWLALDDATEANGCLHVVPGSHQWPILCAEGADTEESFTDITVPLPPGTQTTPVEVGAGGVVFFHGQLVHGSYRNRTDGFRRALIGHYVEGSVVEASVAVAKTAYDVDGNRVHIEAVPDGGPCGVWVDRDGNPVPEVIGEQTGWRPTVAQ